MIDMMKMSPRIFQKKQIPTGLEKLQDEFKEIRKCESLCQIGGSAGPIKKDYFHWKALFIGPKNTPYMYGLYYLEMKFPENYPISGPEVRMRTPTYHPNIDNKNGHICVGYLSEWKKEYNIIGIINVVFDLLGSPNPDSAYNKLDNKKAESFRIKFAKENQIYDWDKCWDDGWKNDDA